MSFDLSGFKRFFEASGPVTRPDQQAFGHGKDGAMDSISVQSMELGVPEKTFESIPYAGANISLGHNLMSGATSMQVIRIGDKTVTLRVNDDGTKRFIQKPGGLYNNPNPGESKTITVPRAYFIKMLDDQWGASTGAMAGPGAGLPPM